MWACVTVTHATTILNILYHFDANFDIGCVLLLPLRPQFVSVGDSSVITGESSLLFLNNASPLSTTHFQFGSIGRRQRCEYRIFGKKQFSSRHVRLLEVTRHESHSFWHICVARGLLQHLYHILEKAEKGNYVFQNILDRRSLSISSR